MSPLIIHLKKNQDPNIFIERAAEMVKEGLLIGYPMEESYGLGVDPTNSIAIQKLIDISSCSNEQFFIFASDLDEAQKIGLFSDVEIKIAQKFWPGNIMLTVPLRETKEPWNIVTGGKNLITIGVPDHPIILAILNSLKNQNQLGAILGIPANTEDNVPISDGKEMVEMYGMNIAFLIEYGVCSVGNMPTIIEFDHKSPINFSTSKKSIKILKEGKISKQEILEVIQIHE